MPIVKIKMNRQITIPKRIFDEMGLKEGEFVEVVRQKDHVLVKPKKLVDPAQALIEERLAEGLEDIQQGRVYGPFQSAEEMILSLHQNKSTKQSTNS